MILVFSGPAEAGPEMLARYRGLGQAPRSNRSACPRCPVPLLQATTMPGLPGAEVVDYELG